MYKNLTEAVKAEYTKKREERKFYIENGFHPSWSEEQKIASDQGIKEYFTSTRWTAYKDGKLSREKAVELATARGMKGIDKDEAETLQKIEWVSQAPALESVSINVEWHKSRTWGNCPKAEIRTQGGVFEGSASGCGYDKESAAVAEALNQARSVLKILYDVKEKNIDKTNEACLGYGAGYGILPAFHGGVGVSCFRSIFEKLGYKWECTGSGKTFDAYRISKN